jgi:hypothetical protein
MEITLKDRALYFKGLLLLICRDRVIRDSEKDLLMAVGRCFDYESEFCETTIRDALINPYLLDDLPTFSNPRIAESFIRDGLRFSRADGAFDESEMAWLKSVAERNGLEGKWFSGNPGDPSDPEPDGSCKPLEAFSLTWT